MSKVALLKVGSFIRSLHHIILHWHRHLFTHPCQVVLHDDVLLEIFDFYTITNPTSGDKTKIEAWQPLAHVCQRWRNLIFGSLRRLNLQLCCTPKTPARDTLDIWPALPLIVSGNVAISLDNIIAALEHNNRVREVHLWGLAHEQVKGVLAAMQVSFPELTALRLFSDDEIMRDRYYSYFLDGSAPRLRIFESEGIEFKGLPKLLLSATHLTDLRLSRIPRYISPDTIVTLLSVSSSLEKFSLECKSRFYSRDLLPQKQSILHTLKFFRYEGSMIYLEDLVTSIDAPHLNHFLITITSLNQINFDTPRLAQFIDRTPKLGQREAHMRSHISDRAYRIRSTFPAWTGIKEFRIEILCREPEQLWFVNQVCNLTPLSMVEDLYINHQYLPMDNSRWLQLLLSFTGVKNLYLSKEFAPDIATVLGELVGERTTEVLPSLQNIFVEQGNARRRRFQDNIFQFVFARRFSGHPSIAILGWDGTM